MKKLVNEKRKSNNKFEDGKCMNDCFKWYHPSILQNTSSFNSNIPTKIIDKNYK